MKGNGPGKKKIQTFQVAGMGKKDVTETLYGFELK